MADRYLCCCVMACVGALLPVFHASGALVLDQQGATLVGGGLGANPGVIQSFKPGADNIAAVSVRVHGSGGPDNDLTINLYEDYSGGVLSGLLATGFKADALRNEDHLIEWTPVLVVPEQTYYLQFVLQANEGEFGLTIGVDVTNPRYRNGDEVSKRGRTPLILARRR